MPDRPAGMFVISLDFELHWGVCDKRSIAEYGPRLLGARAVIPRLLDLFAARGVHATWATVGLLFCRSREELLALTPELRPTYANPSLSSYEHLAEVGADEDADPYHFARSLIERIAATAGQEVATHTFSHYYCREAGQTLEQFAADLRQAVVAAETAGVALRSIVFPRNQVNPEHLAACRAAGLIAYRGNLPHRLYRQGTLKAEPQSLRAGRLLDAYLPLSGYNGFPLPTAGDGLVNVPASRFLRPYSRGLAAFSGMLIARITRDMTRAAQRGELYHLWWHPHNFGLHSDENLRALGLVLDHFARLHDAHGFRSLTMAEVAQEALAR